MQTSAADTGVADTEPHFTTVQETTAERWMIRAAVVAGFWQALGTAVMAVHNVRATHNPLHLVRDVLLAGLVLGLTWGVRKRSFACASLLLAASIIIRALYLPHQHGRHLDAAAIGLVMTSILFGLGVWATHAIDLRANRC